MSRRILADVGKPRFDQCRNVMLADTTRGCLIGLHLGLLYPRREVEGPSTSRESASGRYIGIGSTVARFFSRVI